MIAVGDDACLLSTSEAATVVTTDTLCDQVHFDTTRHALERIGHKCLAISISDVLAMGALPTQALLTFFLPKTFTFEQAQQIFLGAESLAKRHHIEIVGGDTNRFDGPLIVGSTVLGRVAPDQVWGISSAKVGDMLLVTGDFGGSILGKHMDFEPRTAWIQEVAHEFRINAATDVSDSLSLDLAYMMTQSKLGAELNAEAIPIAKAAKELALQSGRRPLDHALTDGEDFELLLSMDPTNAADLLKQYPEMVTAIGQVVSTPGLTLISGKQRTPLKPSGYIH